jgi:putative membrane protein
MPPDEVAGPTSTEMANQRTEMAVDRTALAIERTLMAWIRTSLSMVGFGFTIYKFLSSLETVRPQAPRNVGLFLLVLGTAAAAFGCLDYWEIMRRLSRSGQARFRVLPLVFGVLIGLLGLVLTIWVLVEANRRGRGRPPTGMRIAAVATTDRGLARAVAGL